MIKIDKYIKISCKKAYQPLHGSNTKNTVLFCFTNKNKLLYNNVFTFSAGRSVVF